MVSERAQRLRDALHRAEAGFLRDLPRELLLLLADLGRYADENRNAFIRADVARRAMLAHFEVRFVQERPGVLARALELQNVRLERGAEAIGAMLLGRAEQPFLHRISSP